MLHQAKWKIQKLVGGVIVWRRINMEQNNKKSNTFYTVALKGLVAYPKMVMHFDAAREKTINAVERAVKGDGYVFLAAQQALDVDNPTEKDLFKVGVAAEIK